MRIRSIEVRRIDIPLSRPYAIAFRAISSVGLITVRMEDTAGNVGMGSASPSESVTGEFLDRTEAVLCSIAQRWNDRPFDLKTILTELADYAEAPAARAAAEIALFDLASRQEGRPLVAHLGGPVHRTMPTSVTLGIRSPGEMVADAREQLGAGFRILKLKIGEDPEGDVERVRKVREAVGESVPLRVDMNQGYDLPGLIRFLRATAGCGLEFFEQPFEARDWDSLAALPAEYRSRLAVDESLITERDAQRLLEPDPLCGIFNIKLMKCGGITTAMRIGSIARAHGIALMWGCNDESRVSIAAALHSAFAVSSTSYLDLDGSFDLARDVVSGGFDVIDGEMSLTDLPGLGVTEYH